MTMSRDVLYTSRHMKTSQHGAIDPKVMIAILIILAAVGIWALAMRDNKQVVAPTTTPTPRTSAMPESSVMPSPTASPLPTNDSDASDSSMKTETRVISLEAGSFYYKPVEIRVKKGEKVRIEMTAVDMMHDFNVEELGIKIPITRSGSTASVEFTADKVGTYEYFCSVGNHRSQGQVGTLIVE
jgi:plastocyanin